MKKNGKIEKKLDNIERKTREYKKKVRAKKRKAEYSLGKNSNNLLDKTRFFECLENCLSNVENDQFFLSTPKDSVDKMELWNIYKSLILDNKYIMWKPLICGLHSPQTEFLLSDRHEVMYGGAAGGGKSVGLLAGALMYVHLEDYSAILLRRSISDLCLPGALMDLAFKWLGDTDAKFDSKNNAWNFPSGASLVFGYCGSRNDEQRYRSAQFQYIGVDELTEWDYEEFSFLFSRLRRPSRLDVPLRMRSATNPGGEGHFWVKRRFIDEATKVEGSLFIPAQFYDNPEIDQKSYDKSLSQLPIVKRKQIRDGNWDVNPEGLKFQHGWFSIVKDYPLGYLVARYWDKAATVPKRGLDPDFTVGVKATMANGVFYVIDVEKFRGTPLVNESRIRKTAERDGKAVKIFMEQEPGSAGVNDIDNYGRRVLLGFNFRGEKVSDSKIVRADALSAHAERGCVKLVEGKWINDFLDEIEIFPLGSHDDIVDATSGVFNQLPKHEPVGGGGAPSIFSDRR